MSQVLANELFFGKRLAAGEEDEGDFYGRWHDLFRDSFLEKDRFERFFGEMEGLLGYLPEARRLVHGGFGYGNLLVKGIEVSAVIDWQDARYGDPLFDLAYMILWRPVGLARAAERGGVEENLEERLRCNVYYCGLDAILRQAGQALRVRRGSGRDGTAGRAYAREAIASPGDDARVRRRASPVSRNLKCETRGAANCSL